MSKVEQKEIELTPFYFDNVYGKDYKVIIQVGGRFSSKTYNSQIEMAGNMMSKKDYKLLVIEDLEGTMKDGYYAGLKDKIQLFGHDKAYNITKSPTAIENRLNNNIALFRGYKSDDQKKSVKAIDQVTEIIVEEGEWLDYEDFVSLLHQIRPKHPEDGKLTIIMNPVNEHCFVNKMFIEASPDPSRVIEYFPGTKRPKVFEHDIVTEFEYEGKLVKDITTVLIALSTHHDNPFLTLSQRATIEKLKETDPDKYKQLGEARFIKPGGAYFREFDRDVHVVNPFPIPKHWDRYSSCDYGLDQYAPIWIAVDEQGNNYVYKIGHQSDLIISEAAELWKEINNDDEIVQNYGPPDLWNRRQETGKSAQETFIENGVYLTKADNDRVQGWYALKELLRIYDIRDIQTGETIKTARLKIFNTCTELIKCLEGILKDEKNPNDCAKEPHDITHLCLSGDTIINTTDGDIKIKDLVGKSGYLHCYDEVRKKGTISKYDNVAVTGKNTKMLKVEMCDGTFIKCTYDHPILTSNGWVKAKDIKKNDDIIRIPTHQDML